MRVVLQSNLDPPAGLVNGSQGTITGFEGYDPAKLPRKPEGRDPAQSATAPVLRGTHAKYAEQQIKNFGDANKKQPWPIVRFDNGTERTIYADCTANELGNEEPYSLLSRTQIPLMAGYAITVHKSQVRCDASFVGRPGGHALTDLLPQGMTLDRVIVDLGRAFEPSQIYVARKSALPTWSVKFGVLIAVPVSRARSLQGLKVVALPQRNLGGANPQVKEFFATYLSKK